MNQRVSVFVTTLSLLGAMAVASAHAQSIEKMVVSLPFSFTVGEKTLPAGDYRFEMVSLGGTRSYTKLVIRSADGRTSKFVATMPVQSGTIQQKSRLIFHRYGDQYFLAQAWVAGIDTGWEFRQSRAEERLARTGVERQEVPRP